jgi:hypothetical protein
MPEDRGTAKMTVEAGMGCAAETVNRKEEAKMESAVFNRFELGLTRNDVDLCAHSGVCDFDVFIVSRRDYVVAQLDKIDKETLRAQLKEYGVWDAAELADHTDNCQRIIWLAAWDIREERVSSCE